MDSTKKKSEIERRMKEVLELLGLDLSDSSLQKTAARIAKMYVDEWFDSIGKSLPEFTLEKEVGSSGQTIFVKNIEVTSTCAHHFVPMIGFVHIAYRPSNDLIMGLSNLHQLVRYCAHKPQLQERLGKEIMTALVDLLQTEDVALLVSLRHFCVMARGVEDRSTVVDTLLLRGSFKKNPF